MLALTTMNLLQLFVPFPLVFQMKSKCQPSEFIFTPKITEHEQDVAANRVHENRNENISMFAQKCNEKHN